MAPSLGKIFLIIGVIFLVIGAIFYLSSRLNIPLGKLPGDLVIQGKNLTCFIPLATMIVLSILLSIILTLFSRFVGRK
jgi:membrane associated rhomboid family serine protease